jgi:serine kinase of HPr protein (carbohydrate metabolism regulator)
VTVAGGTSVHATAVAVAGSGVLIRGAAGSGKSSLALALIEDARGDTKLVADDRVVLRPQGGALLASAPDALRGLIEVRGVGIVQRPFLPSVAIRLVVDLLPMEECERLPDAAERLRDLEGIAIPRLRLPIGIPDAATRVRIALAEWVG